MRRVLVDTGPLVAILSGADRYHEICVSELDRLAAPLLTCWPVITEAAWLLRAHPRAVAQLLKSLKSGFLEVLPLTASDAEGMARLVEKYKDRKPQLADLALIHLAGRESIDTVFTLDKRDFQVYRVHREKPLRLLPQS